jgi:mono/diheme cytochrome c family protein
VRLVAPAFLVACSQASPVSAPAPVQKPIAIEPIVEPDPAERSALAAQIESGRQVFAEQCASCHGETGQGTDDGPSIAGKDALPLEPRPGAKRTVQFRSGADVYSFVAANMPADDPGTLTPEQYSAVVAFAFSVNGIKLDKRFDAAVASLIVLHP